MSDTYSVLGMSCGGCAKSVTGALESVHEKAQVSVDLDAKTVSVEGLDEAQVKTAIEAAGFEFKGRV